MRSGKTPFTARQPKDLKVESISLNQTTLSLKIGQSARLIASILPEGASTETVGMFSGNPAVATVDAKGLVTAVNVGETIVACSDTRSGHAAICTVRVTLGAPNKLIQYMSKLRVNSITLKWTAVPGAQQYQVFRKTNGSFQQIALVNSNTYVDDGLKAATTYEYKVRACTPGVNGAAVGPDSPLLVASTRPEAAEKIKFATKDGKVKVIWTPNKAASYYCIYKSTTGKANSFHKVATVKGRNNYLARGMKAGTMAYYKVQTVKVLNGKSFASRLSKTGKVRVK